MSPHENRCSVAIFCGPDAFGGARPLYDAGSSAFPPVSRQPSESQVHQLGISCGNAMAQLANARERNMKYLI
jgi:hypothetical protein